MRAAVFWLLIVAAAALLVLTVVSAVVSAARGVFWLPITSRAFIGVVISSGLFQLAIRVRGRSDARSADRDQG